MSKFISILFLFIVLITNLVKDINHDYKKIQTIEYNHNNFKIPSTVNLASLDKSIEYSLNFNSIHEEYIPHITEEVMNNNNLITYNQNLTIVDERLFDIDKFNEHIKNTAPIDSPFIGRGDMFISIGYELSVNPYYIYAHSSVETGYGKSNIAKSKGNYFGIGAYNSNPSNAYRFVNENEVDKVYHGIYNGTKWIKDNYFDKGLNTLYKMITGKKRYAVYDDGTPNYTWMYDISSLMVNIDY